MSVDRDPIYTIGEFSRLTGLSEKALRLYDERGLLPPADVDPATGYRRYSIDQIDEGRFVAMLRAIDMPLAEIEAVMATPAGERSGAVGRYWYGIERDLDGYRETVRMARGLSEAKERGMSNTDAVVKRGRAEGAFAAIAELAAIDDLGEATNAYNEAMRAAYWDEKDITMVTAIAYAGTSRLLAAASSVDAETAYELRSAAKALMYNLASFSWVGWDETGIEVSPNDGAAGLAAARSNLAMAVDLDKGDLPISRAQWMLGAHLLTAGDHEAARDAFDEAQRDADRAGAQPEEALSAAFAGLADLAAGEAGAEARLDTDLEHLRGTEDGDDFAEQVQTARRVLGV